MISFRASTSTGLDALAAEVRRTVEGNRNHKLYWAVLRAAEEGYDAEDIESALYAAAQDAGLSRRESRLTIRSAFEAANRDGRWGALVSDRPSAQEADALVRKDYPDWPEGWPTDDEHWRRYWTELHPEDVESDDKGQPVVPARPKGREVVLTAADTITPRRVRWLWDGRLPLGACSLTGGREGQGKTLLSIDIAGKVTRGTLPGERFGKPAAVIIVTTEDAWDFTIVPRLMAAGADLSLVYRAEVRTADDIMTGLQLPHDFAALEAVIRQSGAALVILDPLLSRLDANLDTHKDADVRRALEPLVALAGRTGVHINGLIHVNKTATTDPLTSLMASRAFAAVVRAVLFVMKDPEDDAVRLVGQPKNNLGRTDMPTLRFAIDEVEVGSDPDDHKPITAPQMRWLDSTDRTIEDALTFAAQGAQKASKRAEAADWLVRYLQGCEDGKAPSSTVLTAAKAAGFAESPLSRARTQLVKDGDLLVASEGFPRATYWQLSARLILNGPTAQPEAA